MPEAKERVRTLRSEGAKVLVEAGVGVVTTSSTKISQLKSLNSKLPTQVGSDRLSHLVTTSLPQLPLCRLTLTQVTKNYQKGWEAITKTNTRFVEVI